MRKKILIVEDEEMSFYLQVFRDEGYEVHHALDQNAAISVLTSLQPEVMLLDIHLKKGGSGLEVLRQMKERGISPHTKVIVWTGLYFHSEPERTIRREYSDLVVYYLDKPVSIFDLLAKVKELMDASKGRLGFRSWPSQ